MPLGAGATRRNWAKSMVGRVELDQHELRHPDHFRPSWQGGLLGLGENDLQLT